MDHKLMGFAKAIIADAIESGNTTRVDVIHLLKSRLPPAYAGRSVEARHWLVHEGFLEPVSTEFDRTHDNILNVSKKAIIYLQDSGDDYFIKARTALKRGLIGRKDLEKSGLIDEITTDDSGTDKQSSDDNTAAKEVMAEIDQPK